MTTQRVVCKVCEQGELGMRKVHRMSGPAVVIGYILLIPSILGMLIGGLVLISSFLGAAGTSSAMDKVMKEKLAEANIPAAIQQKVIDENPLTEQEKSSLSTEQRNRIAQMRSSRTTHKVGTGIGVAGMIVFGVVIALCSFVGGLIGWLLVMKKKVLQCLSCGATVNAA